MLEGCTLHHIGYTVADILTTAHEFELFGYQAGPLLHDDVLQVEICYLTLQGHDSIELIHQLNNESLEAKLLESNGVIPYHLAFESGNLDQTCHDLDEQGFERLFDPVPVKALGGIRICYFHHPSIGYIEILGV